MAKSIFKTLSSSYTGYHSQLSSCKISEKSNDPILGKFSDGQTDEWTDKIDLIGCFPTDAKHPKHGNSQIW